MKFSIIGTGFIFPAHAQAIRDAGGEIVDVVNAARGEDTWRQMVRTTAADCIVILAPNDLHFQMALESSKHGKKTLSEKPLVLDTKEADMLAKEQDIYTVLQLRHHPLVKKIKASIGEKKISEIEMDIAVYRDASYYASWKGSRKRSGGVLFNLGIHYFDLLLYLFGEPGRTHTSSLNEKTGSGTMEGENYRCRWRVSTDAKRDSQRRVFRINGTDYNFSSKDNLSYENLHRCVYEDLLQGKGILPREARASIALVQKLYGKT